MCTTVAEIDVGFTHKRFCAGTHICLVFRDEMERRRIVSKFVESGLLGNEKVSYFADIVEPSDVLAWMKELDIDLSGAQKDSSFCIEEAELSYCPDGTFIPERMWETIKASYTASKEEGYRNARVTGEMSWALKGLPGSGRLIEYESGINKIVKTHPINAMCQ
jgi:hypothetical protein